MCIVYCLRSCYHDDSNRGFIPAHKLCKMEIAKLYQIVVTLVCFILVSILLIGREEFNLLPKTARKRLAGSEDIQPELYQNIIDKKSKWLDAFPCFRGAFNDTLIVVTFNFPFYDNIKVLNKLYVNVFGKVVHCGGRSQNGGQEPDLIVDLSSGHRGYICMALAIEKYPGFKGYLYVNDDMVVNWWRLLDFDRNKVWQGPEIVDFRQDAYGEIVNKAWMWWTMPVGLEACKKSYEELKTVAEEGNDFEAKKALEIYLKNGEGRPRCGKGWSDFFYVPGRVAKICQRILDIHYKHELFLEMAIMNIIHSLDYKENFEIVKGIFLPDLQLGNSKDSREFWGVYNTTVTFIHPFKYGFEEYAAMNKALVKNWILHITNSLTSCAVSSNDASHR